MEIQKWLWHINMSAPELAERIGCSRTNIYKILKKTTIETDTLMRISLALKCDFFKKLSEEAAKRIAEVEKL